MKTLNDIAKIMNDYAAEIGNTVELIDYCNRLGKSNAAYYLWDDVFYGILTEDEILLFLNTIC